MSWREWLWGKPIVPSSDMLGAATLPSVVIPKAAEPTARGYRNRNPGNLDFNTANDWLGQLGREEGGGRFARFDTHEHGIRALGKLLLNYQAKYKLMTIAGIINRWAPSHENNTSGYAQRVAKMTGFAVDQPIDLRTPAALRAMTAAIITVELGSQPYPGSVIDAGVAMALT